LVRGRRDRYHVNKQEFAICARKRGEPDCYWGPYPKLKGFPEEPTPAERAAEKKKQEAAAAAAKEAARTDASYLAGLASLERGDYDKAIADFTTAIQGDPEDLLNSYLKRATAYEKKGDRDRALADYRKALTLTRDGQTKKEINAAIKKLGMAK